MTIFLPYNPCLVPKALLATVIKLEDIENVCVATSWFFNIEKKNITFIFRASAMLFWLVEGNVKVEL